MLNNDDRDDLMREIADVCSSNIESVVVNSRNFIQSMGSMGNQTKYMIANRWIKEDRQGYEGLAEYVTSILLKYIVNLNIEYTEYSVCNIINEDTFNKVKGCYSINFLREGEEFVSLRNLYTKMRLDFNAENLEVKNIDRISNCVRRVMGGTGLDISNYLFTTLFLDCITSNEDRHTSNLGLIKGYNGFRVAPVFDNGMALLARDNHWKNYSVEAAIKKITLEPFGSRQIDTLVNMCSTFKLIININGLIEELEALNQSNTGYSNMEIDRATKCLFLGLARNKRLWTEYK